MVNFITMQDIKFCKCGYWQTELNKSLCQRLHLLRSLHQWGWDQGRVILDTRLLGESESILEQVPECCREYLQCDLKVVGGSLPCEAL